MGAAGSPDESAARGEAASDRAHGAAYEHHRDPQEALRIRLRELAGSRVRYGYRRLTVLLKREGWEVNAKRIYRLPTEEGLLGEANSCRSLLSSASGADTSASSLALQVGGGVDLSMSRHLALRALEESWCARSFRTEPTTARTAFV